MIINQIKIVIIIIYGFSIRDNSEVAIKKEVQFEERSQLKLEGKIYTSLLNIPKNYDINISSIVL